MIEGALSSVRIGHRRDDVGELPLTNVRPWQSVGPGTEKGSQGLIGDGLRKPIAGHDGTMERNRAQGSLLIFQ